MDKASASANRVSRNMYKWAIPGILSVSLLLTVGVYLTGIQGAFFYDDIPNLLFNRTLAADAHSLDSLTAVIASSNASPFGRPLSMLTFVLSQRLAGGIDPFTFKAMNLGIHLANGMLVFLLVDLMAGTIVPRNTSRWLALWLSVAWLLHPIHVTAVLHVTQRMTLLAAMFSLAGLALYVWGRLSHAPCRKWSAIGAAILLCWPAAFISKETGLLWPLYVAAIEWVLLSRVDRSANRVAMLLMVPFIAGLAAAQAYLGASWLEHGYQMRDFTLPERLLTEARALWFYIRLVLLPYLPDFGMFHDDFVISRGVLTPPSTILSVFGLLALAYFAVKFRQRIPLVSLGVIWFMIGHSMESSILPLIPVQEHRNYLPAIGILLAGSESGRLMIGKLGNKVSGHMLVVLAILPIFWLAIQSVGRSYQFGNELRRTQMEVDFHPRSPRAQEDAGRVLADMGRRYGITDEMMLSQAVSHYERAAELNASAKQPFVSLLGITCALKQKPTAALLSELNRRLRNSKFRPEENAVIVNFAKVESEHANCLTLDQSSSVYDAMLANPELSSQNRSLARLAWANRLLSDTGHIEQAKELLVAALTETPGSAVIRLRYAALLAEKGQVEAARQELKHVKSLGRLSNPEFEQLGGKLLEDQLNDSMNSK